MSEQKQPANPSLVSQHPYRVLALHGYRHSAALLERSAHSLVSKLKHFLQLTYCDSPLIYTVQDCAEEGESCVDDKGRPYRKWWSSSREQLLTQDQYDTLYESLQFLKGTWESQAFDGLFGFSQGSVLAQIFVWMIQMGKLVVRRPPKFLILVSPFPVLECTIAPKLSSHPIVLPTLAICGSSDTLIPLNVSQSIEAYFTQFTCVVHPKGHHVPHHAELVESIRSFLRDRNYSM